MTGSPLHPVSDHVMHTLTTAHFEVLADATDVTLAADARDLAAARVPGLAARVIDAARARPGSAETMGIQLSRHRYQLYREPPGAYNGMRRVYARELVTADLLRGWTDGDGLRWYDPAELITAVFGAPDAYVTVRTSVSRVLILDSGTLVAVQPRPAHRGALP